MKALKKAQLEILGLTMIVLLLSVGILFVIRFVLMAPQSSIRSSFVQKQISQNFLASLVQTTTDCHHASVSDLIEDCGRSRHEIWCGENNAISSCEYVRNIIENRLLAETLNKWNVKYVFMAVKPDGNDAFDPIEHNVPPGSSEVEAKSHPVSLYPEPGVVSLKLKIYK